MTATKDPEDVAVPEGADAYVVLKEDGTIVDFKTGEILGNRYGAIEEHPFQMHLTGKAFDAPGHMRKIRTRQGMQDYLDVRWRVAWLRSEFPTAQMTTEQVEGDETHARFRCVITLPNGAVATGHGSETQQDFADFYEKAETKAIGRACAALGYGTDAAGDEFADAVKEVGESPPRAYAPPVPVPTAPPRDIGYHDESRAPLAKPAPRPANTGGAASIPARGQRPAQGTSAREREMLDVATRGIQPRPAVKPTGGPVKPDVAEQDEHMQSMKPENPPMPEWVASNAAQHDQLEKLKAAGVDVPGMMLDKYGKAEMAELSREQAKDLIIAGREIARGLAAKQA